jgi:hypothetical protein
VLDTDHLSLLERRESAASQILQARLDRLDTGSRATTIADFRKVPRLKVADWTLSSESWPALMRFPEHSISWRGVPIPKTEKNHRKHRRTRKSEPISFRLLSVVFRVFRG